MRGDDEFGELSLCFTSETSMRSIVSRRCLSSCESEEGVWKRGASELTEIGELEMDLPSRVCIEFFLSGFGEGG